MKENHRLLSICTPNKLLGNLIPIQRHGQKISPSLPEIATEKQGCLNSRFLNGKLKFRHIN